MTHDLSRAPMRPEEKLLALPPDLMNRLVHLAPLLRDRAEQITAKRLDRLSAWLEAMARGGAQISEFTSRESLRAVIHPLLLSMLDSWDGTSASLNGYFNGLGDIFQTYLTAGVSFEILLGLTDVQETTLIEALVQLFQAEPDYASPAAQAQTTEAVLRVHNRQLLTITQTYFAQHEAMAVEEREQIIADQQRAIMELSTPIVPVFKSILVLPLVGALDEQRAEMVTEALLLAIVQHQAETIIVDITGLPEVTAQTASYLVRAARAARLLGARILLVGISGRVAMTLIELNVDLGDIITYSDLQAGFQAALADLGLEITPRATAVEQVD
jgi:anti-anti-sigma regulatory factor